MIKKIAIKNFRCFEDFEMDGLAPITIIGGKNNSGKTALLESLIVPMSQKSPSVFLDLISWRTIGKSTISSRQMWNSFFYNLDDTENFSITISFEVADEFQFAATKQYDSVINPSAQSQKIFSESGEKIFSSVKITTKFQQDIFKGEYILPNKLYSEVADVKFQSDEKNPAVLLPYGAVTFYRNITLGSTLAESVSKIGLNRKKKNLLIETMQKFDSEISDINTVLESGTPFVYVTLNSGKHFPINYMGDGINKAVEILIDILNLPNGILLIDEAENGFHYSVYEKLLRIFFETAMQVNCQIIMTSHSREFIESVLNVMNEMQKLNELSYQRLGYLKGKRKAFNFSGDSLFNAFETNMEVR